MNPSPGFRKFLIVLASIICVVYLAYRAFYTFNLSTTYAVIASLILYVGELFGIINLLLFFLQVWEVSEPPAKPVLEGRTVDVFIPTYNEDIQLLRATLEAAVRMDYPHRTYVLDDGRRPEVKALADELGVLYISRQDNRNAKAGNLNNAFEQTEGEFIVVLDADHVPEPHFITRLIGYFADPKLAYVQTPHAFYNFDSFQARLNPQQRRYWEEGHQFYCVIQPGRNYWNAPIFAGSAAMFRRHALKEVGYIAVETITEDMHTGLRLSAKGWKSLAITERLVAGQAAPDITTFHSQRLRWGEGNLSIMAYDNPLFMKGLTLPQRLCYLASMIHWAGGLFKLFIYLTPILMLFTGVPPVSDFNWTLGIVTGTYLLVSLFTLKVVSNGYGSIINSELYSMINFWTQMKATWRAIFKRKNQRFVVTRKRGRQSKQIWTFIRPQVYLILLSILALFWGWGRLWFQISDDYWKPIIPTFWVIFHICLAYLVTRRAFWPVNRRFSIRHEVNLPVEYEIATLSAAPVRFGITADLNETGMALIAYEKLEPGTIIRMTLRGASEVVKCKAEIRTSTPLSREAGFPGYRYGVQFLNLTPPQIDALNRLCLHFAVPRLYEQYNRGNRDNLFRRLTNWRERGMRQRRREARYGYHLPLILNTGTTEETLQYTATEDLSRVATAAIIDQELPPGTPVSYLMSTPLGDVRGTGRAIRSERRQYAGQVYHRATIEFTDFEGQGRNIVQSLANPDQTQTIDPVLRPRKNLPAVKMVGPVLIGLAILVPLLLGLRFLVFKFVHDDDLFLRAKINQTTEISPEDREKIDAIYARTMDERYPSTDRLVLLMSAYQKIDVKSTEIASVTTLLGTRDPKNWDLRAALASSYDRFHKFAEAEREYKLVLDNAERSGYSDEEKKKLYVAAAHASVHADKPDQAAEYFAKALELAKNDQQLRYWYAGVLYNTSTDASLKQAENLLRDSQLNFEGRALLIDVYVRRQKLDDAEREARLLADEYKGSAEAERRIADILLAKKQFTRARTIYQALADNNRDDAELQLKLAQSALASSDIKEAYSRFQALIEKSTAEKRVIPIDYLKGYVDTAASNRVIPEEQIPTLLTVYRQVADTPFQEISYLSRLAWALENAGKLAEAETVMEIAFSRNKELELPYREQYAALLIKREKYSQAAQLVEQFESVEARRLLIIARMKNKEFPAAIVAAEALVKQQPENLKNRELLVDVLCLADDFDRAVAEMSRFPAATPEQKYEVESKKAKILLWAGKKDSANFNLASTQFQKLIEPDIDGRSDLWQYFIDATSSASRVDPSSLDLTKKIAERMKKAPDTKVSTLSRLAWILVRAKQYPLAQPLLDQAIKLAPQQDEETRKELAGVMASAERYRDAVNLMTGIKLDEKGHYTMAQLHSGEKDFTTAEFHIREILKDKPKDQKAREMLANITSWKQEYPQAITMFEELREEYPDEPTYPIRIAEIALWSKEYDRAMDQFAALFVKYPQDTRIWEGFSKAAAQAKSIPFSLHPTALAIAEKVASHPDADNAVLFAATAWMMYKLQNLNLSESLMVRAEEAKITDPAARRELARIYYELRRFREGLKLFENVPLNEEDRYRKIDFAVQLKYAKVVREEAEILLKLKPKDIRARGALAYALSLEEKHKEALAIYEELLKENPGDKVVYRSIADSLLASGYYQEANRRYETLLKDKFDDSDLWLRYIDSAASAVKLETEGQKRLAYQVYDRMVAADIEDAARYSRLAWVMLKHFDDAGRASVMINRALSFNSKVPDVRVEIAGVLARLERISEALLQFEGLDLSKLNIDHRRLYIDLLIAIKPQRLSKAELELKLLLQEKHEEKVQAGLEKLLASVLAWEQKFEESRRMWEDLVRRYPQNPDAQMNLAFVILWSKQYDEALRRFTNFLDKYPEEPKAWVGYVEAVTFASSAGLQDPKVLTRVLDIYNMAMKFEIRTDEDVRNLASLGAALAKLGRKQEALAAFKKALDAAPDSRLAWRRYGETLYAIGEFDEANRVFTDILNGTKPLPPKNPTKIPR